jgi:hypothetical protein
MHSGPEIGRARTGQRIRGLRGNFEIGHNFSLRCRAFLRGL